MVLTHARSHPFQAFSGHHKPLPIKPMTAFYYGHDMRDLLLQPLNLITLLTQELMRHPFSPLHYLKNNHETLANLELLERFTHIYQKPEWHIPYVTKANHEKIFIEATPVIKKDFCTLIHFKRFVDQDHKTPCEEKKLPPLLIVAPYSGHYATLLRDTVRAMLPQHDVYITDWANGRNVPLYQGLFTLEHYIDYLIEFLESFQRPVHMMAVCQPAVPVLAVTSLLASMKSPLQPQSITLMGGPIDTRCSPTAINKLSKERPLDWFENNIVSQVPHYYPGAYRRVIPGFLMLAGFMKLNLETHTKAPRKLFNHMVRGDSESAEAHRIFYNEYRSVLDLPADYYLDSVRTAFQEHLLPRGLMTWRGERVDPSAIEKTAIMTVEGERDDISGVGQTYATHDICTRLSPDKRNHLLQKEVGHYGVFNGRRWREEIQPAIGAFIRQHHQD